MRLYLLSLLSLMLSSIVTALIHCGNHPVNITYCPEGSKCSLAGTSGSRTGTSGSRTGCVAGGRAVDPVVLSVSEFCDLLDGNGICDMQCWFQGSERKECNQNARNDTVQYFKTKLNLFVWSSEKVVVEDSETLLHLLQIRLDVALQNVEIYEILDRTGLPNLNGSSEMFRLSMEALASTDYFSSAQQLADHLQQRLNSPDWNGPTRKFHSNQVFLSTTATTDNNTSAPKTSTLLRYLISGFVAFGLVAIVATAFVFRSRKRKIAQSTGIWLPPFVPQKMSFSDIFEHPPHKRPAPVASVEPQQFEFILNDGRTVLHDICASNRRLLPPVERGLVNRKDSEGRTPLHLLVLNQFKNIQERCFEIELLVRSGADINITDENDETALFSAVKQGKLDIVRSLLRLKADVTIWNQEHETVLHAAVKTCDKEMLALLLSSSNPHQKVDGRPFVDSLDWHQRTPLMQCGEQDLLGVEMARILVRAGANVNDQGTMQLISSYTGRTALHYAAQFDNSPLIRFLVGIENIDIDKADQDGDTALAHGSHHGSVAAVKALLEAGANKRIKNNLSNTALEIARAKHYHSLIRLLERDIRHEQNFVSGMLKNIRRKISPSASIPMPFHTPSSVQPNKNRKRPLTLCGGPSEETEQKMFKGSNHCEDELPSGKPSNPFCTPAQETKTPRALPGSYIPSPNETFHFYGGDNDLYSCVQHVLATPVISQSQLV